MLTSTVTSKSKADDLRRSTGILGEGAQTVVIVNGTPEVLASIESAVEAGRYGVVFIESIEHAYTQIKRVQPNLVILCVRLHEMNGFHVLSMLKLDEATRSIPVVTYAAEEHQEAELEEEEPEQNEVPLFEHAHLEMMN
jgi:CheY-like chemotaxis protein